MIIIPNFNIVDNDEPFNDMYNNKTMFSIIPKINANFGLQQVIIFDMYNMYHPNIQYEKIKSILGIIYI